MNRIEKHAAWLTFALLSWLIINLPLLASTPGQEQSEDDEDVDLLTTIPVPSEYSGMTLEFGEEFIGLTAPKVEVDVDESTHDVALRAADGRILSRDRAIVDANVFEHLDPKKWRLAFEFGEYRWHNAGKTEELLIDAWGSAWGVDLSWTPQKLGPFGLQLGQYLLTTRRKILPDLSAQLGGSKTKLGFFWERVLSRNTSTNLHNVHLQLAAGASLTNWWYAISDNTIRLEDKSRGLGSWGALTTSIPVIENSWIGLGFELSRDPIKLSKFNFETAGTSTRWYVRGAYAF